MTVKLIACTDISGADGKEISFSTSINGAALLAQGLEALGLAANAKYRVLALKKGVTPIWVEPKKNIIHYHLKDNSKIFFLPIMERITVETTSNIRKMLLIDITQPVSQIVKFIAEKLRFPTSEGYAVFTTEDGSLRPMDFNTTLPQQSTNYKKLLFKRRFFFFVKSYMKDNFLSQTILKEIHAHITAAKLPITHEQALNMAYYSLCAQDDDVKDKKVPTDLAPLFPHQSPPEDGDSQKIAELLKQKPLTKEQAIDNYMIAAHQIPYFGCEIMRTKFGPSDKSKGSRQDGTIVCGPKNITVLLPSNEPYLVVPWFRYIDCKEHKGSVDFKYMEKKGEELELSFKVKKPSELATFLNGCQMLTRTLGAQFITDSYIANADNNSNQKIDPEMFKEFYTPNNEMLYVYFPGTLDELKKITDTVDDIIVYQPDLGNDLKNFTEELQKDPGNVIIRLKIIRVLDTLLKFENRSDFLDENLVERAMATISSLSIVPPKIEELIESINFLIDQQKIIRNETMTRIESSKKIQLIEWVKNLKEHRHRLVEFNKVLQKQPTSGTIMLQVKKQLLQLTSDIKALSFFVSQVISMCPDSSYVMTLDNFTKVLKEVTTPIIPSGTDESLNHIFALHNIVFYSGLTIAIINKYLESDEVAKNTELIEKVEAANNELYKVFYKVQEYRSLLNIRPFSVELRQKIIVYLEDLKSKFIQIKPQADIISEISSNETVSEAISYVESLINDNINLFSTDKILPYRRVPQKDQINEILFLLSDIQQSMESALASSSASRQFLEFVQTKRNTLSQISSALLANNNQTLRLSIDTIAKIPEQLKDLLTHLNELTKAIGSASIIHQINKLIDIANNIVAKRTPTFEEFRNIIKEIKEAVASYKGNETSTLKSLLMIIEQTTEFNDLFQFIEGMVAWNENMKESKVPEIISISHMILQLSAAINQLPPKESISKLSLLILPFFQGKDVYKMITELAQQISDINKFLADLLKENVVVSNETFTNIVRHWSNYFDSINGQLDGLQSHESTLISRLKEISRKSGQMKLFVRNILPFTDDHKFSDMLNVFFQNCDLVITKLSQPHITKNQAVEFSEKISPALSQIEILLSRFINNCPPEAEPIIDKLKTLRQTISQRIGDASGHDSSKQQDLADKLYSLLTETLPEIRKYQECSQIVQQLNGLRLQLSEFTALSLSSQGFSSAKFATNVVPASEVKAAFEDTANGKNSSEMVLRLVKALISEPEMLSPPAAYASKVYKNVNPSIESSLRLLVYTQEESEEKTEQIKAMPVNTAVKAANLAKDLRAYIKLIDTSDSEKAEYYKKLIYAEFGRVHPELLIDNPSFPALAMTYSSLHEIRVLATLLLNEKQTPELQKKVEDFSIAINDSDIALKLYFFNHFQKVINNLKELSLINDKASSLYDKVQKYQDSLIGQTILLEQNSLSLNEVVKCYGEVVDDIELLCEEASSEDKELNDLKEELKAIEEIKCIVNNWEAPMKEFNQEEFRRTVLSNLILSQKEQAKINFALKTNIMALPNSSVDSISYLTAALALVKQHMDKVEGVSNYVDMIEKDVEEVNRCNIQLFSDDEAYKADISLQKLIPAMEQRIKLFKGLISALPEPDYSSAELEVHKVPPQIAIVSSTMENTEFDTVTKSICNYVNDVIEEKEEEPLDTNVLINTVELIPICSITELEEGKKSLMETVEQILNDKEVKDEVIPKFVASMIRVLPSISNETLVEFGIEPIVNLLKEMGKKSPHVLSNLSILNSYMNFMNQDLQQLKEESTKTTIKIIEAFDTEDAVEINNIMQNITALKRAIEDKGEKSALLTGISQNLEQIKGGIADTLKNGGKLDEDTASKVLNIKRYLIKSLTGESMALTEAIQSCESIDDVLDVRTNKNLSARMIPNQVEVSDKKAVDNLLYVVSNMHILTTQGLQVTESVPRSFFREYISLFDLSLNTLLRILKSEDADSKKYQRMFHRIVDNIGDMTDDISLLLNSEPLSPFEEIIKQFLVVAVGVESHIANINAAYATAEIPQSFALILNEHIPFIKDKLAELNEKAAILIQKNTLEELTHNFKESLESVSNGIEDFINVNHGIDLISYIEIVLKITSAIEACALNAIQMTDVAQLKYDPESAAKLPSKFKMPHIPSIEDDKKISDYRDALVESRAKLDEEVNGLREISSGYICDNSKFVEKTLSFLEEAKQFIIAIFYVSISSTNLQKQSDLTSVATALVSSIDMVNKSSRSLFLSVPTWNEDQAKGLERVCEQADSAVVIANEAVEISQNEEKSKDEHTAKFTNAARSVMSSSSKAEEAVLELATKDSSALFKTIASNIFSMAVTCSHVVNKVILQAKESQKITSDDNKMIEESEKIANKVLEMIKVSSREEILKETEEFAEVVKDFEGTINKEIKDTETYTTSLEQIHTNIISLRDTVKKAIDAETNKPKVEAKKKVKVLQPTKTPEEKAAAQEKLMKRLELESKVHCSRFWLEHSEKILASYD